MTRSLCLFICILLLHSSCNSFKKAIIGVKTPQIEDAQSIHKFLQNEKLGGFPVYTLSDDGISNRLQLNAVSGYQDFLLVDKNGRMLPVKKEAGVCIDAQYYNGILVGLDKGMEDSFGFVHCDTITFTSFISHRGSDQGIDPGSTDIGARQWIEVQDTILRSAEFLHSQLRNLDGSPAEWMPGARHTIVLFFAKYLGGKMQTREHRAVIKALGNLENPSAFDLVFINTDNFDWRDQFPDHNIGKKSAQKTKI